MLAYVRFVFVEESKLVVLKSIVGPMYFILEVFVLEVYRVLDWSGNCNRQEVFVLLWFFMLLRLI